MEDVKKVPDTFGELELQGCVGVEVEAGEAAGVQVQEAGGGDHGRVVGGVLRRREVDRQPLALRGFVEGAPQTAVAGDSPADQDRAHRNEEVALLIFIFYTLLPSITTRSDHFMPFF